MSKDCPNCPAFGKHCPHKVNEDPYFYDCYLTVAELEKENAELKAKNKWYSEQVCNKECAEVWGQLTKAKELLAKWVELFKPKGGNIPPTPIQVDTEQFLKDETETETEQEEPYYVIMNMNCQYEICRKCPKSGLFKGTYEECKNWIREKLREVEK